jgi:hypothetical protein
MLRFCKSVIISRLEKLHYAELHDLYSTPDNIRLIRSRVMSLVVRVARVTIRETNTVPLWSNLKQRVCLEDVGVGKKIILKWILKG